MTKEGIWSVRIMEDSPWSRDILYRLRIRRLDKGCGVVVLLECDAG